MHSLFTSGANVVKDLDIYKLSSKFVDVIAGGGFAGGAEFWMDSSTPNARVVVAVTAVAGIAIAAAVFYTSRGHLKSPWARSKRKHALSPQQWKLLFTPEGKFQDGGVKFLKQVRSGGVDPSIRAEVWPFLLGVYELNSSEEERYKLRIKKRKEYDKLRRWCRRLLKCNNNVKEHEVRVTNKSGDVENNNHSVDSADTEEGTSSSKETEPSAENSDELSSVLPENHAGSKVDTNAKTSETKSIISESDSDSDSDSSVEVGQTFTASESTEENGLEVTSKEDSSKTEVQSKLAKKEDFTTWQRIIRLDAIRANGEWVAYSPELAAISDERARSSAEAVGLKDYDHLEPCMIFHAARLVAILEAYAVYDPEIGYCQGMSDLLSPIITVMTEDYDAFWCFVGFMKKARHNFRLDEVGIRRQLGKVSKIIKFKDSHLFKHLEMLQAEDCFFVYRMVVVLFRRELTFEQTICLWEVMWADQAAIRAGIGKSAWSIRQSAMPTEDLLLYAIAPDLTAPGVEIVASWSEATTVTGITGDKRVVPFNIISGTSMSCPHATGAAAYVKSFHPTWSPAAIKSALMTTASTLSAAKNIDVEFAYGSGQINPIKAAQPGLIYDAGEAEFVSFLCGQGYSSKSLQLVTGDNTTCSAANNGTVWDLNYPSFALSAPSGTSFIRTFQRTVTNVGTPVSTYKATVNSLPGLNITVLPSVLSFKAIGQKLSFTVTAAATVSSKVLSGSLVWDDGAFQVRSPVVAYSTSS